jgi:hypothetical protein
MHTPKSCQTKRLPTLGLPVVVLLAWGCASQQPAPVPQGPEPAPSTPPGDVAQVEQQAAQIRSLQEDLAELQLQVLGKEAQVAELQAKLDEAIQEVVRTKAKLQSVESRAEAASAMAEAEIALKAVRAATAEPGPEVFEAEQLLEMSGTEFEGENYGGALYLASQAMSLVSIGQGRLGGDDLPRRTGEVQFAIPLRMEVARTSNVREGPGLNFGILFTLQANTKLVGLAYKDQWVRVRDEDERSGWIFHSLVRGSNR